MNFVQLNLVKISYYDLGIIINIVSYRIYPQSYYKTDSIHTY